MLTKRRLVLVLFFSLLISILAFGKASQSTASASRIQLTRNTEEAESVLSILDKRVAGANVTDDDWQHLFATEPYRQLKKREVSLHRDFTDDDFKKFCDVPGAGGESLLATAHARRVATG